MWQMTGCDDLPPQRNQIACDPTLQHRSLLHSTPVSSSRLEKESTELQAKIDHINRERKLQQTAVGANLVQLEAEWQSLVSKNRDIEAACVGLEAEIAEIQGPVSAEPVPNGVLADDAAELPGDGANDTNMSHA